MGDQQHRDAAQANLRKHQLSHAFAQGLFDRIALALDFSDDGDADAGDNDARAPSKRSSANDFGGTDVCAGVGGDDEFSRQLCGDGRVRISLCVCVCVRRSLT